ncbi:MAG TPA: CPBP family intramembrane metalloprotease [Methanobacterium sp.]|nr:CPBP family intramembrane metalloprotease [Methanobacterium sp.]
MKIVESVQNKMFETGFPREYAVTLVFYLLALITAELLTTYVNKIWGLSAHTIILFILLVNAAMVESEDFSNLLRSMMPIPIIRIVGLSIPMMQIKPLYWFPIVAIPLFAASIVIMRRQNLSLKDVGVFMGDYRDNYRVQFFIAITGFFTGIIEFFILRPDPLIAQFTPVLLIGGFIVLLLSTGLAEELLFRGILQKNTMKLIGPAWGLLYTSLIFTTMHIGWIYFADLVFVFSVAMFYGFCLIKTKSIVGITMAHGISNSMLFLVMPFVNLAYFSALIGIHF